MNVGKTLWKVLIAGFTLFLGASCANMKVPEGGPKDEEGPVLEYVKPLPNTLNFRGKELVFRFSEFLKSGAYKDQIFISPVPVTSPEIFVVNKTLTIRFKENLRDSTTYVISFGKDIKDYNEGNSMKEPFTFAFSTGPVMDSLSILGKVINPKTGKGAEGITILLFPDTEIIEDSIFAKKPLYAALSDAEGSFHLNYLAKKPYKIYGVKDNDKSFSYNLINEDIALAQSPKIVFEDNDTMIRKEMYLFPVDQTPPKPGKPRWINENVLEIDFKEALATKYKNDSLRIWALDSLMKDSVEIEYFTQLKESPGKYLLFNPKPSSVPGFIYFSGLFDSLGNRSDTLLQINPGTPVKDYKDKLFFDGKYDLKTNTVSVMSAFPVRLFQSDTLIQLHDTLAKKRISIHYNVDGFELKIGSSHFPKEMKTLQLFVKSGLELRGYNVLDSNYILKINFPDQTAFGSISGKVDNSIWPGNWFVYLLDGKGRIIDKTQGPDFVFSNLKEGKYSFMLLNDEDGNRVWTPGSLFPYRLPEYYYFEPEPVEVKAKWDVESYSIKPTKEKVAAKGKSTDKKSGEDPAKIREIRK